jgi:hypothetical protein
MPIKYNQRSSFLQPVTQGIQSQKFDLENGKEIRIEVTASEDGYAREVQVLIDKHNRQEFRADWEPADSSRFPARIKATATALRDLGYAGRFRISHEKGLIRIRQV